MIALAKPMLGIEEKILESEVLSSGKLAHGEYVEMFERDFALFQGSKHCVATAIPDQSLYQQGEILGSFTNARIAAERVVSIPIHPGLTEQEVDYIVSSLQKYE